MLKPVPICFILDRQADCRAFSRAFAKTGKRIAASIAIIAITTSSSIRVKAERRRLRFGNSIRDVLSRGSGQNDTSVRRRSAGGASFQFRNHYHPLAGGGG